MAEDTLISNDTNDLLNHRFVFTKLSFEQLKEDHIHWNSREKTEYSPVIQIVVENLQINQGLFTYQGPLQVKHLISIIQENHQITLFCDCQPDHEKLCPHQAQVLFNVIKREELGIFFNQKLRQQKLKRFAADYGMENEFDLDLFFDTKYQNGQVIFCPKQAGLIPINREILTGLQSEISGENTVNKSILQWKKPNLLVLRSHKYYHYLVVDLYHAPTSREGQPKNPFTPIEPMDCYLELYGC